MDSLCRSNQDCLRWKVALSSKDSQTVSVRQFKKLPNRLSTNPPCLSQCFERHLPSIRLSSLTAHRTRAHLTTCYTDSLSLCGVLTRPHRHRTRQHAYQSSLLPVLWRAVFVWWSRQTALHNIFIYCKLHRIRAVCGLFFANSFPTEVLLHCLPK